jgi:hypothetical protein
MTIDTFGRVGIGTTTPNASAALEINSTDKGVLVPRIALTAANVAAPVTSPANSLLIYNTTTAGTGSNAVTPGFYYWNSSANRWMPMNESESQNLGYGTWGDCSSSTYTHYTPVASDVGILSYYGYAVDLSGDYAVIGAPIDSLGMGESRGSAWIFKKMGSDWVEFQKLVASDGDDMDLFGGAVAIDGNYAVIGALGDDNGSSIDEGSAYVFHFDGTSWIQQVKLTAADAVAIMKFGISVSIDSHRIVIGAPLADVDGDPHGAAYVFERSGSTWTQQEKLTASDGASGNEFGYDVSLFNDRILVGAPYADLAGPVQSGAGYIFHYSGGLWNEEQKVFPPGPENGEQFGFSVVIRDDLCAIGSPQRDVFGNSDKGAVCVFERTGTVWQRTDHLLNTVGMTAGQMGVSIDMTDKHILAGSPFTDVNGGFNQGVGIFWVNLGGLWKRMTPDLTDSGGEAGFEFGLGVALQDNQFLVGSSKAYSQGIAIFGKIQ